MAGAAIEHDIQRLEAALRQLKVEYDQFFAGALERQPFELRRDVEQILRRWTQTPVNSYAHRFHLTTLVSRYNALSELWGRQIRRQEEGPSSRPGRNGEEGGEKVLFRTLLSGVENDERLLRELHRAYVEASQRLARRGEPIEYVDFHRRLTGQVRSIQRASGCAAVEFRLFSDGGKVRLRARAGSSPECSPGPVAAQEPAR